VPHDLAAIVDELLTPAAADRPKDAREISVRFRAAVADTGERPTEQPGRDRLGPAPGTGPSPKTSPITGPSDAATRLPMRSSIPLAFGVSIALAVVEIVLPDLPDSNVRVVEEADAGAAAPVVLDGGADEKKRDSGTKKSVIPPPEPM
jgi:hypothetical protein